MRFAASTPTSRGKNPKIEVKRERVRTDNDPVSATLLLAEAIIWSTVLSAAMLLVREVRARDPFH